MKLKEIPANTVVHTPTEAEAKELLAILHENGYSWDLETFLTEKSNWSNFAEDTCYRITKYVVYGARYWYESNGDTIITLAEFKERYCEEEKPQLKLKDVDHAIVCNGFNKDGIKDGDKVFVLRYDSENFMAVLNSAIGTIIPAKNLEPYTEPETKPTEDMETKESRNLSQDVANCDKSEDKELNLCGLIGNRSGIHVYCPICGEVALQAWGRSKNNKPLIFAQNATNIVVRTFADGKAYAGGECIIYPSRALWEQYPLDPYTAWMKWQEEEQKPKYYIEVHCGVTNGIDENLGKVLFRTPTDRDKCIEEIKTIIEKYSR